MKSLRQLSLALVLTLLPLASANANSIINGGFENPDIPTGTFQIFASIPGWSTTFGPGIEIQDHVAGNPFEGDQFVELDSTANSGMIQSVVATTAGQLYNFGFAYSPRQGVSAESNTIQVFFNGGLLDTLAISGFGLSNTNWAFYSYNVTAVSTSSTIEFRAAGTSNSLGGYLDDVQFNTVPEPASLLTLGIAVAACGFGRRFKSLS